MNIIEKIKLLFKLKEPVTELVGQVKEAKSGWKTPHFWVTVLTTLGTIATVVAGYVPAVTGVIITTTIVSLYNVARAIENSNMPGIQPMLLSTRFWTGVLGIVGNALIALQQGGLTAPWIATVSGIIAAIMAASQSIGAQQPDTSAAAPQGEATPQ